MFQCWRKSNTGWWRTWAQALQTLSDSAEPFYATVRLLLLLQTVWFHELNATCRYKALLESTDCSLQMDWSNAWKSWRKQQSSTKVKREKNWSSVNLSADPFVFCEITEMSSLLIWCFRQADSVEIYLLPLFACRADGAHKEAAPSFLWALSNSQRWVTNQSQIL